MAISCYAAYLQVTLLNSSFRIRGRNMQTDSFAPFVSSVTAQFLGLIAPCGIFTACSIAWSYVLAAYFQIIWFPVSICFTVAFLSIWMIGTMFAEANSNEVFRPARNALCWAIINFGSVALFYLVLAALY